GHAEGICHVYVDAAALPGMAKEIVLDAKLQYAAACNAAETVLVHEACAPALLPELLGALAARGVAVRGCARTRELWGGCVSEATQRDFRTEYGDAVVNVKVVEGLEAAVAHIHAYGSGHTETIATEDA